MTADHREVEDTYDLDDATVLPDLSVLRGVTTVSRTDQELRATYFDTPGLALATAGVTLRRRTGGEDAGWHLKLPVHGARLEIAVPLGRAVRNPPVALRQVVAGLVRDDRLAPVVTIHTDRAVHRLHDERGLVLAEVADDRVSTESVDPEAPGPALLTWREAEVELVIGDRALLEEAGSAAGLGGGTALRRSLEAGPCPGRPARRARARAARADEEGARSRRDPAAAPGAGGGPATARPLGASRRTRGGARHAGGGPPAAARDGQLPPVPRRGRRRAVARRARLARRPPRRSPRRRGPPRGAPEPGRRRAPGRWSVARSWPGSTKTSACSTTPPART